MLSNYKSLIFYLLFPASASKWKVHEEMAKAIKRDRSIVHVHELSGLGLMEISRQRVCISHLPTSILLVWSWWEVSGIVRLVSKYIAPKDCEATILVLIVPQNIQFSPSYPQSEPLLILKVCVLLSLNMNFQLSPLVPIDSQLSHMNPLLLYYYIIVLTFD